MNPIPSVLLSSPWGDWLAAAPDIAIDNSGDAYAKRANAWLADQPGHNSPLSPPEYDALLNWVTRYQLKLLQTKIGEVSLGQDRLVVSFAGLFAAIAGISVAVKLGVSSLAAAAIVVAAGMAIISLIVALLGVRRDAAKLRKGNLINQVINALDILLVNRSA
jgi:hypothetical protein